MSAEDAAQLLDEASGLPQGSSRVAICEEAVRLADKHGDDRLRYEAREQLLEASIFGGFPEKALVAFSWLVAKSDEEPDKFPESQTVGGVWLLGVDLLWSYKWVVQNTPGFPQISRAQIEKTLDDMETRYRRNNVSLRPVWMNRMRVGIALGDPDETITEYFGQWSRAPRDLYADCAACEQNFEVEYHHHVRDYAAAAEAARPLIDGELSCAEVPHITISNMVMPTWEEGELVRAAQLHRRGYEMCRDNRDFLHELTEHVDYRLVTGDLAGALELAEKHLPWVADSRVGERRWRWALTLGELFGALARERAEVSARIPEALLPERAEAPYDPTVLAEHFRTLADDWTRQFDARNGNDAVTRRAARLRERVRG